MSFSSIPFVFLFFPAAVLLHRLCPRRLRTGLLVLLSLLFCAWGDVKSLAVLVFSAAFNYLSALETEGWRERGRESMAAAAFWVAAAADVLILVFYKYFAGGPLPAGLSFYTFSALSYLADVRRGRAPAERDPLRAALYMTFFPKLISGPIVRYEEFYGQLDAAPERGDLAAGCEKFLAGLFKKVLLADRLGAAFAAVRGTAALSAGSAWLGMIFYSLQLFFDFSGYSDMAIGLARMLGFRFAENFDHPYLSGSVSEFWRRWHISLGAWFREYVYIPLGGNRCGRGRQLFNLAVVWLLTGVWHGSTLNFVVWGLYHGLFVMAERLLGGRLDGVPRPLRVLFTDLVVFFGWVLFFSPSLGGALMWFSQMFGADGLGLWDAAATYWLTDNLWLLLASLLFCGPLMANLRENLVVRRPALGIPLSAAIIAVLLLFSAAGMVNATYSTFLYFQF